MKVEIIIKKGRYSESVNNGAEYISVSYFGHNEGCSGPCDTEEEVKSSIADYSKRIIANGDKPVIVDQRIKQETLF